MLRIALPLLLIAFAHLGAAATIDVSGPKDRLPWFEKRVPELLSQVEEALGFRYEGRIHVRLAPDDAAFARLAGDVPDWVAAVALPAASELVVRLTAVGPARATDSSSVLRHELVHVVLPERVGRGTFVPRWFEEGLAQVLGGRVARSDALTLPITAAAGRVFPLDQITHAFPRDGVLAGIAYAQSESVVGYLVQQKGVTGLRGLLDALKRTGSMDAALEAEYGYGGAELETRWRRWFAEESDPWWLALLTGSIVPLLLFASSILVILAVLRARRSRRRTYESLPE